LAKICRYKRNAQFPGRFQHPIEDQSAVCSTVRITVLTTSSSFANILNKKGVPLPTIQKLMRHRCIETTMIYIETREEEMRNAINLVG
jgi:site-specific recombinase XerD